MRWRAGPRVHGRVTIPEVVCCLSVGGARPFSMADFLETFVLTAANPKGLVFYVALLPQFVDADRGTTVQLSVLAVTFVALSTSNATLYATLASSMRRMLDSASGQHRFTSSPDLFSSAPPYGH